MSSTIEPTLTLSISISAPPKFTNTPPNQPLDPTLNSPSVFLYGFLATLTLVFFVFICVAWRAYRIRRILHARIDDAIARGTWVPGYDPENPPSAFVQTAGTRGRILKVVNRPVMFEEWIGGEGEGEGIIKPAFLDVLKPYDPPPPRPPTTTRQHHRTSPFSQLLEPLREYWFVPPRPGADPTQLQGRPGRRGRREEWVGTLGGRPIDALDTPEESQGEEKEKSLDDVREVRAGVLIAMPDRTHPRWGNTAAGVGYPSGPGGYAAIQSWSRPNSWQPSQGAVASALRPSSSSSVHPGHRTSTSIGTGATLVVQEEGRRELPELVLGVVGFGVEERAGDPGEEKEGVEEGKGKEIERTQPGLIPL